MEKNAGLEADIRFARSIARRVVRESAGRIDVKEAEAEALLALCESKRRFKPEFGVNFRTFAFLRIRGAVVDIARRSRRRALFEICELAESAAKNRDELCSDGLWGGGFQSAEDAYESKALQRIFEDLIQTLSQNEQSVVRTLYFQDRHPSEAGKLLGNRSKSWVSRYHRDALYSLRIALCRYWTEERARMASTI